MSIAVLLLLAWSPFVQGGRPAATELDSKHSVLRRLEDSENLLYIKERAYVVDGVYIINGTKVDCEDCNNGELGADCLKKESDLLLKLQNEWQSTTELQRVGFLLAIARMGYKHSFPYSPRTSLILVHYLDRERSVEVQAAAAVALGHGAHSPTVAAVLSEYSNDILARLAAAKLKQRVTSEQSSKLRKKLGLHKKKSSRPRRAPKKARLEEYKEAMNLAGMARADHAIMQSILVGCVNALGRVQGDRCTEILLACCSDEEYMSFPERYPALFHHGTRSCVAKAIECFGRWESKANDLDEQIKKLSKSKMGPMPKSWEGGRKAWREYYPRWKSSRGVALSMEQYDMKMQRVDLWWTMEKFASRRGLPEPDRSLSGWNEWFDEYGSEFPVSLTSK